MRKGNVWMALAVLGAMAVPVAAQQGSRDFPVAARAAEASSRAEGAAPMAATSLNEGFSDIGTLAGNGWSMQNLSVPTGLIANWFQGTAISGGGPFDAHQGATNAYIAANYNFVAGNNTINGWLMTPELDFGRDASFTFWTRKATGSTDYPDRLEVRLSTQGASTNAGSSATNVGDFTTLLLSINPTLVAAGYPYTWTQYTVTNAQGVPRNGTGRIAFRYFVTNGGPSGTNSDYIGIDTVGYSVGAMQYQVEATVSGLQGDQVALSLNGGTAEVRVADGSFTFPDFVDQGAAFTVAVTGQPQSPKQTCVATPASGTIGSANAQVAITCTTDPFTLTVVEGSGQEAPIHDMFPLPLVAELLDGAGEPVAGAQITYEAPASGASAWLADEVSGPATTLSTTTDAAGHASVLAVANDQGGCYGVIASHPNAVAPVAWELTNVWYPEIFSDGFETPFASKRGVSVCGPDERAGR